MGIPVNPTTSRVLVASVLAKKGTRKSGKSVKKENLPVKTCQVCGRPFTWRKKWEKASSCGDIVPCSSQPAQLDSRNRRAMARVPYA